MTTAAVRRTPQPVRIAIGPRSLNGDLAVPAKPIGLVIFAHGSGSSRLSPRNRYVADVLDQHSLATLLIDLLTPEEEIVDDRTARLRFDIGLLAERPEAFSAIVSRGGRPDLAGPALPRVTAPTLLIVGGADQPVIELNEQAMRQMRSETRLEIVPRATHLFEEPGALERVADLAARWFERHLRT